MLKKSWKWPASYTVDATRGTDEGNPQKKYEQAFFGMISDLRARQPCNEEAGE
jgi:hypothetical protein